MRYFRFTPLLVLALALPVPALAAQRTLKVPGQYPNIQSAINAAWIANDTVLVSPGTYRENLNFFGKRIIVKSTHGPQATVIDGGHNGSVVTFNSLETNDSVLDGFTITNGTGTSWQSQQAGGGIFVFNASPTVRNCSIMGNASQRGGGLYVEAGSPRVLANWISGNLADQGGACHFRAYPGRAELEGNRLVGNRAAVGGGAYVQGEAAILNNLFAGNFATNNGAGAYLSSSAGVPVLHCVFVGNQVTSLQYVSAITIHDAPHSGVGLANCVVWNNPGTLVISTGANVTFSDVQGGFAGLGNIDQDPLFVDEAGGDFHLRYDSPCREAGTNQVYGLPATDFEGDPRVVGTYADMGIDEFSPRLYSTGDATPQGTLRFRFIGFPSDPVLWAVSLNPSLYDPPLTLPGIQGKLYVSFPMYLVPMGFIPSKGYLPFTLRFPANFPVPATHPMQALIGLQLTDAHIVTVQ